MNRLNFNQSQTQSLGVSVNLAEELRDLWNERVKDPFAFVPSNERDRITEEQAKQANMEMGKFAADYLRHLLQNSTDADKTRRLRGNKRILAAGYGKGYDADWLREALLACLQTVWIDVSDLACKWASDSLEEQMRKIALSGFKGRVRYPEYQVIRSEICMALSNPTTIDMDRVEISYLCRTIGCFKTKKMVRATLQKLGTPLRLEADPEKGNRIVLIVALTEDNPFHAGVTSTLYSRKFILSNLRQAAKRPVETCFEASYRYFDQIYTAMTIKAR